MGQLDPILPPALLGELQKLWFKHVLSEDDMVVPCQDTMMKWFKKDEEFDRTCSNIFRSSLDKVKSQDIAAQSILESTKPTSPLDWISLIILFDQIPRNIYRGAESNLVFTNFDPIAQHIADAAISAGVYQHPDVKYRIAQRVWITMPFMHSEGLDQHEKAVNLIQGMLDDVMAVEDTWQQSTGESIKGDEELARCMRIIAGNKGAAIQLCESQLQFELRHKVIIDKLGRYPHRNSPLGRATTKEEQEFLDNGGDTFGG